MNNVTVTWDSSQIAKVPAIYSLLLNVSGALINMRNKVDYTFKAETLEGESYKVYSFTVVAISGPSTP